MQTGPLRYSSPYPGTNPLQIFQGDPAAGALGNGNYLFGNLMIDVSREGLFFAAALAQKPFSRAGAFGRKPGAKPAVSQPKAIQLTACKASIVTGVGNRYQPKINPKPVLDFRFWRLRNFNGSKEQPQVIPAKEIALTFPGAKQFTLALAAEERNGEPPIDGPDADQLCVYVPGKDAPVEGYRTALPKDPLPPLIQFVSVGHFGDEPDNDLSRKCKFFADLAIKESLQPELVKLPGVPGELAQPVSRSVSPPERTLQRVGLLRQRLQFDLDSQFHSPESICSCEHIQQNNNPSGIPPTAKSHGLPALPFCDLGAIRRLGFPVFARGTALPGTTKSGRGNIGVVTTCGGALVWPGDIIVADESGIVVIRPDETQSVLARAEERCRKELAMMDQLRGGRTTMDPLGLDEKSAGG